MLVQWIRLSLQSNLNQPLRPQVLVPETRKVIGCLRVCRHATGRIAFASFNTQRSITCQTEPKQRQNIRLRADGPRLPLVRQKLAFTLPFVPERSASQPLVVVPVLPLIRMLFGAKHRKGT